MKNEKVIFKKKVWVTTSKFSIRHDNYSIEWSISQITSTIKISFSESVDEETLFAKLNGISNNISFKSKATC